MDRETIGYIDDLTEAIHRAYNLKTPINDVSRLVNTLGGELLIGRRYWDSYESSDNTIMKLKDDWSLNTPIFRIRTPIFIETKAELNKVNTLIDIGYIFLHLGYKIDPELWRSQKSGEYLKLYTPMRYNQARYFAISLLMPKAEYLNSVNRHTYKGRNTVDIEAVAKEFNVHVSSATLRGRQLGILE